MMAVAVKFFEVDWMLKIVHIPRGQAAAPVDPVEKQFHL